MRGARHKYIGVHRRPDGKYDVHVMSNGKSHYGGAFDDEIEAAEASCNPGYKITEAQLKYLAQRIMSLQRLTKRMCQARIESYHSA